MCTGSLVDSRLLFSILLLSFGRVYNVDREEHDVCTLPSFDCTRRFPLSVRDSLMATQKGDCRW